MNKRKSLWGCLLAIVLVLIILAIGGGLWLFRSQPGISEFPPPSQVLVFLLTPSSGDEVKAGDFVPVTVQAVAPEAIQSTELFVDGQSLGLVTDSPQSASWTWQAWPLGLHTFTVRATDSNGQVGESQAVLVNVLAGDGVMQVFAEEGQTLEQIGTGFGVPPDQMAGANPKVDPSQPLPGGKPVKVPIGGAGAGSGSGQGSGQNQNFGVGPLLIPIEWKIKFTQPVDKSYCYTSNGKGVWEKMPKDPFNFFQGTENLITQLNQASKQVIIQVQCWGWLGNVLKYLGQGQTQFDVLEPPGEIKIEGGGFVMTGLPKLPPIKESKFTAGGKIYVPPPFAVRKPSSAADCAAHGHPLLAPFICNKLMSPTTTQYFVLEWEWAPKSCWGGNCQWYDKIDGYRIYEYDTFTLARKLITDIKQPNQKIAAIPVPWGTKCYAVVAYVLDPGTEPSNEAHYCGDQPPPNKVTLTKLEGWLTAVDLLDEGDDCKAPDDGYYDYKKGVGEVFTGGYDVDSDYTDCYENVSYTGAVKFKMPLSLVPSGAFIQKANLRFSPIYKKYNTDEVAGYGPESCVSAVGKAKKAWSGLSDADHWINYSGLAGYGTPITSVPDYGPIAVNVTSVVSDWLKNPGNNHGFIIYGDDPPNGNYAYCISGLSNFQLDIYYFAP